MDRVRLGRALGFGARAAAKTLVQAADAAMSPNPTGSAKPTAKPAQTSSPTSATPATAPATASSPRPRAGNVVNATGRMGRAVFEPVKRHSRELWLQITGSFFALLAVTMGGGAWALRETFRSALHNGHAALWSQSAFKFYLAVAACLMFAYFSVSNFVRASRSSAKHKLS